MRMCGVCGCVRMCELCGCMRMCEVCEDARICVAVRMYTWPSSGYTVMNQK